MDGFDMASAYLGTGTFVTSVAGSQPGVFPNLYGEANGIHAQLSGLAPEVDWTSMNDIDGGTGPAESFPPSQNLPSLDQEFSPITIDPSNLWSDAIKSHKDTSSQNLSERDAESISSWTFSNARPISSISLHSRQSISTNASTDYNSSYMALSFSAAQLQHDRSVRARHAANQRHKRSKDSRKESHRTESSSEEPSDTKVNKTSKKQLSMREKNKVAAAKCRSRQRKQVRNIELKYNHLSAANGELKRQMRDLSGELNNLRSLALNHQTCDCRIAVYNYHQAKRIVAGLQASNMEENIERNMMQTQEV